MSSGDSQRQSDSKRQGDSLRQSDKPHSGHAASQRTAARAERSRPPLRAVLFDNDGTLVDSERLCNLALQQQFAGYGVDLPLAELLAQYRGGRLHDIFSRLCAAHQLHLPADYETEYRARLQQLFAAQLSPVEGATALLQQLQQQGLTLAVVSNGPLSKMRFTLEHCGLLPFFTAGSDAATTPLTAKAQRLFSAYDCGLFKPDPALYLHAAAALGLAPAQCIVVEDSLPGVQAAVGAGMRTFFLNHYQESCPAGAIELTALAELIPVLRQLDGDSSAFAPV